MKPTVIGRPLVEGNRLTPYAGKSGLLGRVVDDVRGQVLEVGARVGLRRRQLAVPLDVYGAAVAAGRPSSRRSGCAAARPCPCRTRGCRPRRSRRSSGSPMIVAGSSLNRPLTRGLAPMLSPAMTVACRAPYCRCLSAHGLGEVRGAAGELAVHGQAGRLEVAVEVVPGEQVDVGGLLGWCLPAQSTETLSDSVLAPAMVTAPAGGGPVTASGAAATAPSATTISPDAGRAGTQKGRDHGFLRRNHGRDEESLRTRRTVARRG